MTGTRAVIDDQKSLHQWGDDHYITYHDTSFAAGGTQSAIADLDGKCPIRVIVPGTYSATQGQTLRIKLGATNLVLYPLWASATAVTVKVEPGKVYSLDTTKFWGVRYMQFVSTEPRGTASTQHASLVTVVARMV